MGSSGGRTDRLSGSKTIRMDVRLVATTHKNLTTMIEDGSFRQDLSSRLSRVPIELPLLWERLEDIPVLADFFS